MNYILHIDCDAFYASCEELRDPKLKDKPIAVGGLTNKSIITTANYKARKYGLHSAMPVFIARELCPHVILIPVDHAYYREKSIEVFDVIIKYAEIFEQVSIDEAYLKVITDDPLSLARQIQDEVFKNTGINVSIGISYNKFLAKLASDRNKPHGIKEIAKDDIPQILLPLKISKVHGIGNRGVDKLHKIGIYNISDLMKLDLDFLVDNFGKHGVYIYEVIRGIDKREVKPYRERKSMGRERTFRENTNDKEILLKYLYEISKKIESDLEKKNLMGKTLSLKIKDKDFIITSKAITLQEPIYKKEDIYQVSKELFFEVYDSTDLRLIGISLSKLSGRELDQLSFL